MIGLYHPDTYTVVEQDQSLAIVSRAALADELMADKPDLQPGDVALVTGVFPIGLLMMMGVPADEIDVMIDGMFDSMIARGTNTGGIDEVQLEYAAGNVAAVSFDDLDQEISGILFLADADDDQVVLFGIAMGLRADLDANRRRLGQVIASMEFTGDLSAMMEGF